MSQFEEELIKLIGDWLEKGADPDTIISAMELQMMAVQEQKKDDEE